MINFIEYYALIIGVLSIVIFVVSLKYENVVVGKKVLNEFDAPEEKKCYVFHQRINILMYALIALAVCFFPAIRNPIFILSMVFAVLVRGMFINKKYLNRWTVRK